MAMSKKDYELIADTLRSIANKGGDNCYFPGAVYYLATELAKNNSRFDRQKFIDRVYKDQDN